MSMNSRWSTAIGWMNRHYIFAVTVGVLLVYGLTYSASPFGDPIMSDGAGYYAYLPSLIIYGDPSFEIDATNQYGGEFPPWTYVRIYPPTGRYLNALNIGVSLMILPFFLVAHLLTVWFGFPWEGGHAFLQMRFPLDGYSFFYQHGAGLAGVFYFLLGFAILKKLLDRHFPPGVVLATMTVMLLGTNLLYYGAVFTVNAHPYTFFLSVVLIALTCRWYADPANRFAVIGLGVVAAMLYLVRPLNALMIVWIPLYGLTTRVSFVERLRFCWERRGDILWMVAAAIVVMIPQFLIWKYSSGHFVVKAYQHVDASSFGVPQLGAFFFGIRKGVFPWFPVFVLVACGFLRMRGQMRAYLLPIITLVVAYSHITSSLTIWESAGGFGNRYVVDLAAYAMFPLAAFYAGLERVKVRVLVGVCSVVLVCWALFLLTLLYRREIGYYGLDAQALFDVFWWRKDAIVNWLVHRGP